MAQGEFAKERMNSDPICASKEYEEELDHAHEKVDELGDEEEVFHQVLTKE